MKSICFMCLLAVSFSAWSQMATPIDVSAHDKVRDSSEAQIQTTTPPASKVYRSKKLRIQKHGKHHQERHSKRSRPKTAKSTPNTP